MVHLIVKKEQRPLGAADAFTEDGAQHSRGRFQFADSRRLTTVSVVLRELCICFDLVRSSGHIGEVSNPSRE